MNFKLTKFRRREGIYFEETKKNTMEEESLLKTNNMHIQRKVGGLLN